MMGVRSMDIVCMQISTGKSRDCLDAEFLELMDQCLLDAKPHEACSAEHTKAFIHIFLIPHLTVSLGPLESFEASLDPCPLPEGLAKHM